MNCPLPLPHTCAARLRALTFAWCRRGPAAVAMSLQISPFTSLSSGPSLALSLALLWALPAQHASAQTEPVLEDVPFITTPDAVTLAMLNAAGTGSQDHVIDLGSGDGRIVITAALRFGATGLGVEIVPDLVLRSRAAAQAAGVAARVSFREQDLFATDLSAATVITMYLLPEFNLKLRPALLALKPGTRLVSHDWDMGDWQPDRTETLAVPDKKVGLEKLSRVHLWWVPAQVAGAWCGPSGQRLELTQQYQTLRGGYSPRRGERLDLVGRLRGAAITLTGLQTAFSGEAVASGGGVSTGQASLQATNR